jgi:hypothetical protein
LRYPLLQVGCQDASDVNGIALRAIVNLMAATRAIGNHPTIRRLPNCW